jgi:hypothetical protein
MHRFRLLSIFGEPVRRTLFVAGAGTAEDRHVLPP